MNTVRTHFAATRMPFSKLAASHAFMSRDLRQTASQLSVLEALGGLAVCVGEPGSGKTFAVEAASLQQRAADRSVFWIDDPGHSLFSFFRRAVAAIGAPMRHNTEALWQQLASFISSESQHGDRSLLWIIDEAQQLTSDILEAIRRLTNLSRSRPATLQIVLIGHGQVLAPFNSSQRLALRRRLTAVAELVGLTREELDDYLQHHLECAGIDQQLFETAAINHLWSLSRGLPRLINILGAHSLFAAAEQQRFSVSAEILTAVAQKMKLS